VLAQVSPNYGVCMAGFCTQCAERLFGEDFGDFAGLCDRGGEATVLCEGCGGVIGVDYTGYRLWKSKNLSLDKESCSKDNS